MLPLELKNKYIRIFLIRFGVIVGLSFLILLGIEVYLRLTETHIVKIEESGGLPSVELDAEFTEDIPQQLIREKARKRNFPFLDLLPYLRKYRRDHKDIYYDWCHPAAETNDYIGKIIAKFLFKETLQTAD